MESVDRKRPSWVDDAALSQRIVPFHMRLAFWTKKVNTNSVGDTFSFILKIRSNFNKLVSHRWRHQTDKMAIGGTTLQQVTRLFLPKEHPISQQTKGRSADFTIENPRKMWNIERLSIRTALFPRISGLGRTDARSCPNTEKPWSLQATSGDSLGIFLRLGMVGRGLLCYKEV